ncbi:MAG TPA: hypothetical protein VJ964_06955 [Balneolaceae bacterium]|nr:hypothetical protein [Balneolaceae bacterium]
MSKFKELNQKEYLEIYGGRPTDDTSFFYDVGWLIGTGIRKVESWFD